MRVRVTLEIETNQGEEDTFAAAAGYLIYQHGESPTDRCSEEMVELVVSDAVCGQFGDTPHVQDWELLHSHVELVEEGVDGS